MNFDIKGLDFLIRALSRLKIHNPSERFKLLVVGKGNEKKYGSMAEGLGIKDHVIFTGIMPRELLERIYVASDVFSMLSRFDTFGMAALEAMAASLPVIISASVGARDLVRDGENGFVVIDPTQEEAVADRIGRMLRNDIREKMAQEAGNTAGKHSWKVAVAEIQSVYKEILAGG